MTPRRAGGAAWTASVAGCLTSAALALGQALPAPSGYALIIGNAAYPDALLRTPVNDARSVAELLELRGYDVTLRTDLDAAATTVLLGTFRDRIADTRLPVVFYFAGHGTQINGVNYLIPVSPEIRAREDVAAKTLSLNALFTALGAANPSSPKVVVLDACRPNPFGESSPVEWTPGFAPPVDAPQNSLVAYSTQPGNVAADGVGQHSPFSRSLLRHLIEPGLPVEQLFKQVRVDVEANTDIQSPTEFSLLTTKDLSLTPRLMLGVAIKDGDDDVIVSVNGSEVASWNGNGRTRKAVPLHAGSNPVIVRVYNQRSYTGGIPFVGGHFPEGWRYTVAFDMGDRLAPFQLADREDRPEDNGPRHGKLFTAARFDIVVDGRTMKATVSGTVVAPWR